MNLKKTNFLILISFFPVFIFRSNLSFIELFFSLILFLVPILSINFFFFKKIITNSFFFRFYLSSIIIFGIDNNLGLWNGLIQPMGYFLIDAFKIIYLPSLIIFIILILTVNFINLKTKNKFYNVFLIFIFTIFIFNIFDPTKSQNNIKNFTVKSNNTYKNTKVIIIFDEMSGANSLASTAKGGSDYLNFLKKFLKKNNFEHYNNAKSNNRNTVSSVSSLLNFNKKKRLDVVKSSSNYFFEYNLEESLLFQKYNNISIFQSMHINYCNFKKVSKCESYNPFNQKKFLTGYKDTLLSKIVSLWKFNGSIISVLTWRSLRELMVIDSPLEPEGHKASFQDLFNKIENDIYSNKYDLIFVHTLVPHKPYGFDKNCNYDGSLSTSNLYYSKEKHLIQHNIERKCVIIYLEKFLEQLTINNKIDHIDLTILSDHGSRITRDPNSSLSALFAVKNNKTVYKEIDKKVVIQELFYKLNN